MGGIRVQSTNLKVADVELELLDTGQGTRPVLFLHGGGGFTPQQPFVAPLSEKRRFVAPTHPGFGKSDLPDWLDTVDDIAHLRGPRQASNTQQGRTSRLTGARTRSRLHRDRGLTLQTMRNYRSVVRFCIGGQGRPRSQPGGNSGARASADFDPRRGCSLAILSARTFLRTAIELLEWPLAY